MAETGNGYIETIILYSLLSRWQEQGIGGIYLIVSFVYSPFPVFATKAVFTLKILEIIM